MFDGKIYDNDIEVGVFRYSGNNINHKIKTINYISINKDYIDLSREHSTKQLTYKYYNETNPIVLGVGYIYFFSAWCNSSDVLMNESYLINNLVKQKYDN